VIGRAVGRTLSVLFGFLLAVLAGAITLFALGLSWAAEEAVRYAEEPQDEMTHMIHEGFGMLAFFVTVSPVLTLLPAIAVAVAGELARIRSVFYYVAAGGLATAVMPLIASFREDVHGQAAYSAEYFAILATAGFAGGLVYWLVTGRNA
jgi:hypothetical protein